MTTLFQILLIEDNPSDAVLFIDQLQQELVGQEVNVSWKKRLSEALAELEAHPVGFFDQIWLDPGLPDLGQQSDVSVALSTLKKYLLSPGALRMLSSEVAPGVKKEAARQKVEVFEKGRMFADGDILEIVLKELTRKRSTGSVSKTEVQLARVEGSIVTLEKSICDLKMALDALVQRLDTQEDAIRGLGLEMQFSKPILNKVPELEKIVSSKQDGKEIRIERMKLIGVILVALLGSGALAKVIDVFMPSPAPAVSPPAQKEH